MSRRRRLVILRGTAAHTAARIQATLARSTALAPASVAWVSADGPGEVGDVGGAAVWIQPRALVDHLGQGFDAVVLDGHGGLDADRLGQAHGLVRGGGSLLLRLDPELDLAGLAHLAAYPYTAEDVGRRFVTLVEGRLARWHTPLPERLPAADHRTVGSDEQARLVAALVERWRRAGPSRTVLLADRGRGKSSALGLALAQARAGADQQPAWIVSAGEVRSVGEVLRFAGDAARFVATRELVAQGPGDSTRADADPGPRPVIVVDEAAQLPVPLLQQLVAVHADAHLAFATTTHGYEGTGRGFSLRFLAWLRRQEVAVDVEVLTQPIRWGADDPLEQAIVTALLLDAEPAPGPFADPREAAGRAELSILDRDALVADRTRLRQLFGLLIQAHYRTTPADLQRLLDAPNLEIHAATLDGQIVAANLIAEEGGLPPALIDAVARGRTRLRAHALADVLVAHLGRGEAGSLRMRRSVRIAVHPALRRGGLASRLIAHVHDAHPEVDLFGTLFGATAEIIAMRRRLGYRLVRVGASRGPRSGEPSVMMLRPVSPAAIELVADLREELARELPMQLALLQADEQLALEPALLTALGQDLPPPRSRTAAERRALLEAYVAGPRTFESLATVVHDFAAQADRATLDPSLRAVVEGRVLHGRGWAEVARAAGLSPPAAMRGLRRAIRQLLAGAG